MTYRPFTLEGNFAFAAGLQEMLLQSYAGFIEIFPAVPAEWKDIEFNNLRAEGAFLVSVKKLKGEVKEVKIVSEKGGKTKMKLPFRRWSVASNNDFTLKISGDFIELSAKPGGMLVLRT